MMQWMFTLQLQTPEMVCMFRADKTMNFNLTSSTFTTVAHEHTIGNHLDDKIHITCMYSRPHHIPVNWTIRPHQTETQTRCKLLLKAFKSIEQSLGRSSVFEYCYTHCMQIHRGNNSKASISFCSSKSFNSIVLCGWL